MRRLAIALLTTAAGLSLFAGGVSAQDDQGDDPTPDTVVTPGGATIAPVDVLQVSGFMDDILVAEIRDVIAAAAPAG